jgi:hypothetical protein
MLRISSCWVHGYNCGYNYGWFAQLYNRLKINATLRTYILPKNQNWSPGCAAQALRASDWLAFAGRSAATWTQYYRQATSDLAMAQRDFPRHQVTGYLNQLVGRAHAVIYRDEPLQANRLSRFALRGFPRLFRKTLPFTLARPCSSFCRPWRRVFRFTFGLSRRAGCCRSKCRG